MGPKPSVTVILTRQLMSPLFPVLILLVFVALATWLKTGLDAEEQVQIMQSLETKTQTLTQDLEKDFLNHVTALRRMAQRRAAFPDMEQDTWQEDARNYLLDFNTFQAIEWIDRDLYIRWVEPVNENEVAYGYNVGFNEQRRHSLENAAVSGQLDISGIIELAQGGPGLVAYAPISQGEDNNGFIAGVFRMERLAQAMVTPQVLGLVRINIIENGDFAFALPSSGVEFESFSYVHPVNLPTIDWALEVTPTRAWADRHRSFWPQATFISLVTLGVLISLTTLLVQLVLKRNQDLLRTRLELDEEIDQRMAVQQDLARLRSTDPLTGLANRRFFMEDLEHTLIQAERQLRQVALILIDLDRFQTLNDSRGHLFGDELLACVARRLEQLSDERVMVAYFGGDEFMICQQHVEDLDDVIHLLGLIKDCFKDPFTLQDEDHSVTATMGIAIYPQSGLNADLLLRNADIALYRAKEQARNTYQFYTEGMQEREVQRLELDKDLSEALARNQFSLYYQPQLDLSTNQVSDVEALIRWHHPQKGLILPMEFIPLAEESGRISEIGRWVIRAACEQLRNWQDTSLAHLCIAINLSGRELAEEGLADYIARSLEETGARPEQLKIELTEEIFIDNIERNLAQLARIRKLGVHLAIDDFGVGYSSLAYLRDFPVDLLKIDRSFITEVTERHDDAVITRAIINLAHNLGIQVVAEGVETEAQLQFLKDHQCDLVQGFLFSRPVPASELAEVLSHGRIPEKHSDFH